MLSKTELRKELQAHRQRLTRQEVDRASALVELRVLSLPYWAVATRAHVYSSNVSWNELETVELQHALLERYPNLTIETSSVDASAEIPTNSYDIVIVPVLGFDSTGNRLGLGAGWYDRFLTTQAHAHKVGLAYSWMKIDRLPHELHDVALDYIITEQATIQF